MMRKNAILVLTACAAALVLAAGCAARRPVLYPNPKLQEVGAAQANQDVDQCMEMAKQAGLKPSAVGKTAGQTAIGAGAGAALGAVVGAITGGAGSGAAVGAAAGGTGGFLHGIFGSREPSAAEKGYVDQCLIDKGYQPVGWQ